MFSRELEWPRQPEGCQLSMVTGVASDSNGRVYVAHRGPHPLLLFDAGGNYLETIGEAELLPSVYYKFSVNPPVAMGQRFWIHGLSVDPWDNVWITDVGRHIVMKFSPEGRPLLRLGTPDVSGAGPALFNQPTHALVAPSGHIYVTDGYGNSRVVQFSPEGRYVRNWGKRGTGPGEFNIPHAITMDSGGRIYVADRANDRIQVFSEDGDFLAEWPELGSIDAVVVWEGDLYAGAGLDNRILKLDLGGRLLESWGTGDVLGYPHGLCHDGKGNFYVAELMANRATKLRLQAVKKTKDQPAGASR